MHNVNKRLRYHPKQKCTETMNLIKKHSKSAKNMTDIECSPAKTYYFYINYLFLNRFTEKM